MAKKKASKPAKKKAGGTVPDKEAWAKFDKMLDKAKKPSK